MGEKYKFLEHTADALFEAYGKSFEEAVENAALAFFEQASPHSEPKESFEIEVQAQTKEELVIFLLSDLLTEMDIREVSLAKLEVLSYDENEDRLKARAWGEKKQYTGDVKAVTHHMMELEEKGGKWRIRVLLDI